jgi:hypothetical protein
MTLGSPTSIRLNDTASNMRVVNIFNGQLYVSSATGTNLGVNTVGTGLPTTGDQANPLKLLPGFVTSTSSNALSSYDFWFKDANTLYVADDGTAANRGGIQKWTLSAGTWTLQYTLLNNGSTTTGTRGLTGTTNGSGDAVLYGTTTQTSANNLITVTDTGAGATATTLATAPVNTIFRGIAWSPAASVTPPNILSIALSGGNFEFTWQSVSGKTYVVESRDLVNTGAWTTNATIVAAGTSTSYTNTTSVTQRFYRVGQTP